MSKENITNHSKLSDEELVVLSLADRDSFRYLIERYEEKLRRYSMKLGIARIGETDDLLQNTFIKVYENLAGFNTDLSFSSWVYRIAHNEAMTMFRRRKVRPEGNLIQIEDSDLHKIASDIDVLKYATSKELENTTQKSLVELDQKYKEVIILFYFEHKSYDEISDILKLSPGTVATRIRRAKNKLKQIMVNQGYVYE